MLRMRLIRRLYARFSELNAHRRALLVEASLLLALARIALLVFPFRVIAARLGVYLPPDTAQARQALIGTPANAALASDIGWAVTRSARYLPYKPVCLPQAIAGKFMLRRRGVPSVLHFGAAKGDVSAKFFEAHAWLDAAGVEVTGYPVAHNFTEIACFV